MKMFDQHLHARPVPPSQRTELPIAPELDALVMRCLEKDPQRRPQDAAELLELSARCLGSEAWTNEDAHRWWEHHLAELCRPLTLAMPASAGVS